MLIAEFRRKAMFQQDSKSKVWILLLFTLLVYSGCDTLNEISFLSAGIKYGGNNEVSILGNGQAYKGWDDGSAIVDPVWISGNPIHSDPVCYIRSKPGSPSRLKVEVLVQVGKVGQEFTLIGMEGNTEIFHKDNIVSTGQKQKVSLISKVNLPSTVGILTKTFNWKAIYTGGQSGSISDLGSSTHKIYIVYDSPITNVEGQTNNPTPQRLDLVLVAATGKSNPVDIANAIASKIASQINASYGYYESFENPRWRVLARDASDWQVNGLDCHHRAALAASAFGIAGIKGVVDKCYATTYPVPTPPSGVNPTVNDYMSYYYDNRFKYRTNWARMMFPGNNFEGNLRTEDNSLDDQHVWWTIWPFKMHNTGKDLLIWYANGCQIWSDAQNVYIPVPTNHLDNKPKIIGGPN
jgi:hypothetical protein